MRAVFIREFGGPEKVQVGEWATPEPRPGKVHIRMGSQEDYRRMLRLAA